MSEAEELKRLVRAVMESLDKESELHRQLRRTKESLVSVALRLQVAVKIIDEDSVTIRALQNEAIECRKVAMSSNTQATIAAEMIQSLNLEISGLKRKLKELEENQNEYTGGRGGVSSLLPPPPAAIGKSDINLDPTHLNEEADAEVVRLMATDLNKMKILPNMGGDVGNATPFERWKMQQFLFSPDTPAASALHDKQSVDMLMAAATAHLGRPRENTLTQLTKSTVAKARSERALQRETELLDTSHGTGAASFEGLSSQDEFFMSNGQSRWGATEKFDLENKARLNLWTSISDGSPGVGRGGPRKKQHKHQQQQQQQQGHPPRSPLKLASLQHSSASPLPSPSPVGRKADMGGGLDKRHVNLNTPDAGRGSPAVKSVNMVSV